VDRIYTKRAPHSQYGSDVSSVDVGVGGGVGGGGDDFGECRLVLVVVLV
jgi:hypothetical protein